MRVSGRTGALRVRCFAGSRVILFGMDIDPAARNGMRGFAIRRVDHSMNDEERWLENLRVFAVNDPGRAAHGKNLFLTTATSAAGRATASVSEALAIHAEATLFDDEAGQLVSAAFLTASLDRTVTPRNVFRSLENPIQAFKWGDYTTQPGHRYTYYVTSMYGDPGALREIGRASCRERV